MWLRVYKYLIITCLSDDDGGGDDNDGDDDNNLEGGEFLKYSFLFCWLLLHSDDNFTS